MFVNVPTKRNKALQIYTALTKSGVYNQCSLCQNSATTSNIMKTKQ